MEEQQRRLALLCTRARRLGARDPEETAQEALRRSLENPTSREATEYHFDPHPERLPNPPAWPASQLMGWLYGVVQILVLEEQHPSHRREVANFETAPSETVDPSPDQLELLILREQRHLALDSFASLGEKYRQVLRMRAAGMKYCEIAVRMGVSENTVATWVSRGVRLLSAHWRDRTKFAH